MAKGQVIIVLALVACLQLSVVEAATYEDENRLFTNLTTGYMMCVRPSLPTAVDVFYSIRTLESLNIASQTMQTTGWLTLTWTDPRLVWTPSDFGNIEALEVDFIWRPRFVIDNQVDTVTWHGTSTQVFRIFNNGSVRWNVPLMVETSCDIDVIMFPFDTQTCGLSLNFWTVSETEITSGLSRSEVNTAFFSQNGEWELQKSSAEKNVMTTCCPTEELPAYKFSMTFSRRRPYYVINLLLPTLLMSVVVVLTFLLPVESGERLGYSLTVLLSYTVILTLTTEFLPTTSIQTPHIAIYVLVVLVLSTLAVALTVVNVKFYHMTSEPPFTLRKVCARIEGLLFCTTCAAKRTESKVNVIAVKPQRHETPTDLDDVSIDDKDDISGAKEMDWQRISEILDRLYFYMFLMVIIGLNIMFLAFLA